ncbi:hypothetical protein C8R44DRAFT_774041, partial [Mycena epipterygia]
CTRAGGGTPPLYALDRRIQSRRWWPLSWRVSSSAALGAVRSVSPMRCRSRSR